MRLKEQLSAEAVARAAAIEEAATVCKQYGDGARYVYQREEFTACEARIRDIATTPAGYVCVRVDLLDALSSEEGAEQKDINEARRIIEAARPYQVAKYCTT